MKNRALIRTRTIARIYDRDTRYRGEILQHKEALINGGEINIYLNFKESLLVFDKNTAYTETLWHMGVIELAGVPCVAKIHSCTEY